MDIDSIQNRIIATEDLIEHRETESNALEKARKELLIIEQELRADEDTLHDPKNLELLIHAVSLIGVCHDHAGDTSKQKNLRDNLKKLVDKLRQLREKNPPDAWGTNKSETDIIHDIQNQAFNHFFNNYFFKEIPWRINELLKERRSMKIPKPDILTGQMLGVRGQASAYLSWWDQEETDSARKYFQESLEHFPKDDRNAAMSINFLATLEWQAGDNAKALEWMRNHHQPIDFTSPNDLARRFEDLQRFVNERIFDAVNLFRITLGTTVELPALEAVSKAILAREYKGHPHPQSCRWLGAIAMTTGQLDIALTLFEESIKTSQKSGFAVRTLALPALALKAACLSRQSKGEESSTATEKTLDEAKQLCCESTSFERCHKKSGGEDTLKKICEGGDEAINLASRLLPWSYS